MAATAFGTMGEDSNLKFVQSLTSVGDTFDTVKGTMESIKNVKYDDINSQITELSRSIQMQIGDQIKNLLPYAKSGLKMVSENLVPIESGIVGLGTAIGVWKVLQNEAFRSAVLSAATYISSLDKDTDRCKYGIKCCDECESNGAFCFSSRRGGSCTGCIMGNVR